MKKFKPEEIKSLFPIEIVITKEILSKAIYNDRNNCIAATSLKLKLPLELHELIDWGTGIGRVGSVPIRSMTKIKDKEQEHYLQSTNTKEGDVIKFIVDNSNTRK